MIFSLLLPLALLVLVLIAVGAAVQRSRGGSGQPTSRQELSGQSVRRFFQYLLLAGLLFAAATGVTGLLARVLEQDPLLVPDTSSLALQLTFTVIALPVWGALCWWTVRRLQADPQERRSLGWTAYLVIVELVSLIAAIIAWQRTLSMAAALETYRAFPVAQLVIWTSIWAVHHWWSYRTTAPGQRRVQQLLGSLIGLVIAAVGLVRLLAPTLQELSGLAGGSFVNNTVEDLLAGAIPFLIGAAVWLTYWLLGAVRGPRDTPWLAVVLLAGVGGGLVSAILAASALACDLLIWLLGRPLIQEGSSLFGAAWVQLATVIVGLLIWWYHREVLQSGPTALARQPFGTEAGQAPGPARSEVRRVYEYLLSGIGLTTAAFGLVSIIVTIVEAIASRADVVIGGSAMNPLLVALVQLAVGIPLWWWHWGRAQRARATDPAAELGSPTRRIYLLLVFGVAGIVAVIAVLTIVYLILDDVLGGTADAETVRRTRFALGYLTAASLVSAYHWTIFRVDRAAEPRTAGTAPPPGASAAGSAPAEGSAPAAGSAPAETGRPAPAAADGGTILLIGAPASAELIEALSRASGRTVQSVGRTDLAPQPWSLEDLMAAVHGAGQALGPDLVVLAEPTALRVIPVDR